MRRQANNDCGLRIADCGVAGRRLSDRAVPARFGRGLTLIELLVTIVIMVAVLAGVIPLMSPNNNARKIREASRQLNSMLQQAQAQAARDGRPAGVAFRESGAGPQYSGMALEAFMIAEPAPFAGFSQNSQIRLRFHEGAVTQVQFVLAGQFNPDTAKQPWADYPDEAYVVENAPPNMLKFGDKFFVRGFEFEINDKDQDGDDTDDIDRDPDPFTRGDYYTKLDTVPRATFDCQYIGSEFFAPRAVMVPVPPVTPLPGRSVLPYYGWSNPMSYTVHRQPANTSDAPLQFPRGMGIDIQGSGAVGGAGVPGDFDDKEVPEIDNLDAPDTVGIMFNPDGTLEGLYYNGVPHRNVSQVFMLVGAFVNGNTSLRPEDFDFIVNPAQDRDSYNQRKSRVNWMNADSCWVSVTRAGRVLTSDNDASFDPSSTEFLQDIRQLPVEDQDEAQIDRQLEFARVNATKMQQEGGR